MTISTVTTERLKSAKEELAAWLDGYDPVADKEQYATLSASVAAISELLAVREAQPVWVDTEIHEAIQDILQGRMSGAGRYVSFHKNQRPDGFKQLMPVYTAPPAPAVPDDYFASLVAKARLSADKAMRKHPQPNYVLLKVAEEAGDVIQAGVHFAENRMDWNHVEGEIVQLMAMLIRLVTEGDQVNGITPPDSCRAAIQENTPKAALSMAPAVNIGNMENTSGWIACSDRLPTEGGRYLAWVEEQNSLGLSCYADNVAWHDDAVGFRATGAVNFWMPLPAAPTPTNQAVPCGSDCATLNVDRKTYGKAFRVVESDDDQD